MYPTSPLFWTLMGLYCAVIIGVSIYYVKAVKNADDFFGASRVTPWWAAGVSYFMTAFSASAFVAAASFTYSYGGLKVISIVLSVFTFLAGYYFFSRRWHRTGCKTAVEYIQQRFGDRAAKFFVFTGIPIRILDNANRIYVTAVLTYTILGLPLWAGAMLTTFVAFLSAVTGGFLSVVATDAIQAVVLAVITTIIACFSISMVGGFDALIEKLPAAYWSLNPPDSGYDIPFVIALTVVGIASWNGYWALVQRVVSVKTERDAQLVSLTSGISYYLLFPLFMLPPMAAAVLVPGLTGAAETEQSYLLLAKMILPMGMLGVFFFALVSASVTALNGEFNVVAQVVVEDIIRPLKPALVEKSGVLLGRLLVAVMAIACLIFSLFIPLLGGSFHFLAVLMGMTTLPTFLPLLFGLYNRKTPGWGAILAFILGITTSAVMEFGYHLSLFWIVMANFSVTMLTLLISGYVASAEHEPSVKRLYALLDHQPREPEASPIAPVGTAPAPGEVDVGTPMLKVIGWTLLILTAISAISFFETGANHAPTAWMVGGLLGFGAACLAVPYCRRSGKDAAKPPVTDLVPVSKP